MFDFYEQRKIRQFLYSWPLLILLGIILVIFLRAAWGASVQERETQVIKQQRLAYLEELEAREASIQAEIDRLSTGRGIEEEIRQKFEVAKEGEKVIVIVDAPEDSGPSSEKSSRGFFQRVADFFSFKR
jgi:cell division protein FtsB